MFENLDLDVSKAEFCFLFLAKVVYHHVTYSCYSTDTLTVLCFHL